MHMHCREGNLDPLFLEDLLQPDIGLAPDLELLARAHRHLQAHGNPVVAEVLDPLHLQRLDHVGREFGIGGKLGAKLLDQLAQDLHVGLVAHGHAELVDDPVTAHVLDCPQISERHRAQGAAMVAQLHRAQAKAFDGALVAAGLDVFADAEGIVEQVEHARDHVLDHRLRAKADGHANHAGARD